MEITRFATITLFIATIRGNRSHIIVYSRDFGVAKTIGYSLNLELTCIALYFHFFNGETNSIVMPQTRGVR